MELVEAIAPPKETYTTREICRLARVSKRQLQWWDEIGIVSPIKNDHRRTYTAAELLTIEKIRELRRAGIHLYELKKYLKWHFSSARKITVPTIIDGVLIVPK